TSAPITCSMRRSVEPCFRASPSEQRTRLVAHAYGEYRRCYLDARALVEWQCAMLVVIDTNVLVSALYKPGSVPDRAIAALWERNATVIFDARIADEYRSVLARPKFRAIERARIDALLALLFARGQEVSTVASWDGPLRDEADRIFVELALSAAA